MKPLILLLTAIAFLYSTAITPAQELMPDAQRIEQIEAWLPKNPQGVGAPISNREAWKNLAQHPRLKDIIPQAQKLIARPMPQLTDELYLEYSRNGNRTHFQNVENDLRKRLRYAVLAECLENEGRFLPAIEEAIRYRCSLKSWSLPAHDSDLDDFNGKTHIVELRSSSIAWNLATINWLLGDKLSPQTRTLLYENVRQRVLDPVMEMYHGRQPAANWLARTSSNWNAVCQAQTTGAALALLENPRDRALFIAGAEKHLQRFLNGFGDDGYCSEGVGYWGYGFGRYLLLTETLYQATSGKIDMLKFSQVPAIAKYGWTIQLNPGLVPAFADCSIDAEPEPWMLYYLRQKLNLPLGPAQFDMTSTEGEIPQIVLWSFPNSATRAASFDVPAILPLRTWFPQGQVLICRPAETAHIGLTAAIKGGHNAEMHNHNDVGSYVVALDGVLLLADPGAEVYTRRTFGRDRYASNALNSFGHPVPLVAGEKQRTGRQAQAKILKTDFTPTCDTLEMDIASAYNIKTLKHLTRTFTYNREGSGSLTIIDDVRFSEPHTFATALITFARIETCNGQTLILTEKNKTLKITITSEAFFILDQQPVNEDFSCGKHPTRIGIHLTEPVNTARVSIKIEPQNSPLEQ